MSNETEFVGNPCCANPCRECPWRRKSLPGFIGPFTAAFWIHLVHGEEPIACHMTIGQGGSWEGAKQCAGAASYRANVAKSPRDPRVARGPKRGDVFDSPQQFLDHHDPAMAAVRLRTRVPLSHDGSSVKG